MSTTRIRYKDRTIDLRPYFEGFPFFGFMIAEKMEKLFYFHRGKHETLLYQTQLHPSPDLEGGIQVSDLDFSKFSAGNFEFDAGRNIAYFVGDERNDEVFNIYALDLNSGRKTRITNETYIYGKKFFADEQKIVFISRNKTDHRMESKLRELDLRTHDIKTLLTDTDAWTFTWTSFLNQSGTYIFQVTANYDRNQANFMSYTPETKRQKILLEPGVKRAATALLPRWLDAETFCYLSDENGYLNCYSYHVPSKTSRSITNWTTPIGSAGLFEADSRSVLLVTQTYPINDKLIALDPVTGRELYHEEIDGKLTLPSGEHKRIFAWTTAHTTPFSIREFHISFSDDKLEIRKEPFLSYPEQLRKKIVHGHVEAIKYPTFDIDPHTSKARMIHAFLLIPENLPENPAERRAIVTAFYGGDNFYNKQYQIFLQAGLIVLSPSIRGSWGFGAEFYSLNDRDLGGNEIIDLIFAGRYLAERFGLKEQQIGLQGGSHGGYCAMRALTFPEEVNGQRRFFNWGFAVSSFGISNIVDYYKTCNIPDWVLQKAGDPDTEKEKLMDRSPVCHADRATGPLLLIHGENDNRVPVDQSRQMAKAMEKAGKQCTFIEIPGQGHGWIGLQENLKYYRELFAFLNQLDNVSHSG